MSLPSLRKRVDDYSYQLSADGDAKFWFRLEREPDKDVITDFFLGSFPESESGVLLAQCYKTLDLAPATTIVFQDIYSGREPDPQMAIRRRRMYTSAGEHVMGAFGISPIDSRIEEHRGKTNIVLAGRRA